MTSKKQNDTDLAGFIESSPDPTVITNPVTGEIVETNPAAAEFFGYTTEELCSMDTLALHPDDKRDQYQSLLKVGMDQQSAVISQIENESPVFAVTSDGEQIPVEIRVWNIESDANDQPRTQLVFRDISERLRWKREQEQASKRAEQFFEMAGNIFILLELNGKIIKINDRGRRLLGYEKGELVGRDWFEVGLPEEVEPEVSDVFDKIESGTLDGVERNANYIETKAGDRRYIQWYNSPFRDSDGEITSVLSTGIDITERKENEVALEETREQLRQVIDLVPDPIFVKNRDGEFLLTNEATAKTFGLSPNEIEGKKQRDVVDDPDTVKSFRDADLAVMEAGESSKTLEEVTLPDGQTKIFYTTRIPYEVPGSGEEAVLGYARDVTELKEYEETLEEQRDNLQVLNQVVRHDIRNNLSIIKMYAELLEEDVESDDLDTIIEQTEDAIELSKSAKDLTNVMLEDSPELDETDLGSLLDEIIDNHRSAFPESQIINNADDQMDVLADEMLSAVFRNLLKNAILHNDKDMPTVEVTTEYRDTVVRITVADNGPGIPDDMKEEIFAKGETGLESEGTGIGLYLVQRLVNRYRGDVWVKDNDPEGSVFIIELPIAE